MATLAVAIGRLIDLFKPDDYRNYSSVFRARHSEIYARPLDMMQSDRIPL
jgi:hypothetical protein